MKYDLNFPPTMMGFLSIIFWSTTVAFSRDLITILGVLNFSFIVLLLSGILLMTIDFFKYRNNFLKTIKSIPSGYFLKVGFFFVCYVVLFYTALGEATDKEAVLVVGLLNYLWPAFCFIFSIVILKNRSYFSLLMIGILISFAGTILAIAESNSFTDILLNQGIGKNGMSFLLAFFAAVSWGAYSNLTKKYQFENDSIALPLLFLISSLVIFLMILLGGNLKSLTMLSRLSKSHFFEFIYLIVFPSAISYFFWDRAMKKGNKILIVSFSFLIPILSTITTGIVLNTKMSSKIGIAAILIIIGAVFCSRAVIEDW